MRLAVALCVAFSFFIAIQGIYIIDNFNTGTTSRLTCQLDPDPNQVGRMLPKNCTNSVPPSAGTVTIGNSDRDLWIASQGASTTIRPTISVSTGALRSEPGAYALSWSVPSGTIATLQVKWDGTGTDPYTINYNGYNVDTTENGENQGILFRTLTSDLAAPLIFRVFSGNAQTFSEFRIDSTVANVNSSTFVIPFSNFRKPPVATAPGDFTRVTAMIFFVDIPLTSSSKAVDLSVTDLKTAPLFTVTKEAEVMDGAEMVANPGEIIQFTVTLANDLDLLGINFTGIYFYDNPSALSPFFRLIPGIQVNTFYTLPTAPPVTPTPNVVVGSGNSPGDTFISVYYGTLNDGFAVEFVFNVSLTNLTCQLDACDYTQTPSGLPAGCMISAQTAVDSRCFCSRNQGRLCLNTVDVTDGLARITNNDQAFLLANCKLSDDPDTNAVSDSTAAPIWAGPDPAITKTLVNPAQSSGVGPNTLVVYNLGISNNQGRFSGTATVCESIPVGTTFSAANSDGTWTEMVGGAPCSATSSNCCRNIGVLDPRHTSTIRFGLTVNSGLACEVSQITNVATISTDQQNVCGDINLNNNQANLTIPIIGGSDVYITKASNKDPVRIGTDTSVVYTLTYGNSGSRDASGVTIFESIPALATFDASTSTANWQQVNATHYSLNIGTLGPNVGPLSATFGVTLPSSIDCGVNSMANSVSITNTCADTNPSNNAASLTVTLQAVPDLQLNMTRSGPFNAAGSVCYTLGWINVGPRTQTGTVLYETVPTHTTFTTTGSTSGWTCANNGAAGSSCSFNIGRVTTGQTGSAVFCLNVNSAISCGATTANMANINGTCNEVDLTRNSVSETAPVNAAAVLSISKSTTATSVTTGGVIVYTINYGNTGNGEATGVSITETVPMNTMFSYEAANSSNGWNPSGNTYTYSVGSLAGGASGSVRFAIRLTAAGLPGCATGPVTNTATITQTCGGVTTPVVSNVVSTPIVGNPDLAVTAPAPATVNLAVSQTGTVSFNIRNLGNMAGLSSQVSVTVPQYATPVSDPNFQLVGSNLVYNIGTINAGQTIPTLTLSYTIQRPLDCGIDSIPVTITVSTNCTDINMSNNAVTVNIPIVAVPDMRVTKTDGLNGASVRVGATITYTIRYSNTGYRNGRAVMLTEEVGQYGVVIASENPAWNCNGNTCTYAHPGGTMSMNDGEETLTFMIHVSDNVPANARIRNTVRINNTCGEANEADNVDTEETPVVGNPDLVITKTDNAFVARPWDVIVYELNYGNIGDSDAPDVVITETVPAWTFFSAPYSSPGWSCPDRSGAGTICTYNAGLVRRGATQPTLTFAVQVGDWIRCGINYTTNFVNIAAPPSVVELSYANNNDTEVTPFIATPNLQIHVTDNLNDNARWSRVMPGGLIIYQIDYNNCGNRDSINTTIYSVVPDWTVFNAANSTPGWNCTTGAAEDTVCSIVVGMRGALMPHDKGTVYFAVNVVSVFPPEVKGTREDVWITNDCDELDPIDNIDHDHTPFVGVPDLMITETGRCRSIHWYIEYSNMGDQSASNVVLTETLPAGTTFNSAASSAGWTYVPTSGLYTYSLSGELAPGAGGHLDFVTDTLPDAIRGTYHNIVTISGTGRPGINDPTPENNRDESHVGFDGCPISCDSCCPEQEECCPDKTEVVFNFGGILDGVSQCQS